MRHTLSQLLFPFTLSATLYGVHYVNTHYAINPEVVASLTLVLCGIWIWAWEFILPYRINWNKNDGDLRTDAIHLTVQGVITKIAKPLYVMLLFPLVTYLSNAVGSDNLWPHQWPILLQLLLVLIIAEFGRYWFHRAAHRISWLWKFHAVHHSPNRLYWLNAGRFHPVEKFYLQIPELLPFILLGPSEEVFLLYIVTNGVHGFFQHSNIKTRIGWLNYLFSMTELHRWHHSKIIEKSDTNFGNILILWDMVFGTFYWPKNKEVGTVGVLNPEYPKGYIKQLFAPFKNRIDKPKDYNERKEFYHQQAILECNLPKELEATEKT